MTWASNQIEQTMSGGPPRKTSSRLFRLWCWLWFGHDHDPMGRTVLICKRCGGSIVGGD